MFDNANYVGRVDDSALIDMITTSAADEARAASRRLAAIAELTVRRCDDQDGRSLWACDGWADACAEIGAALMLGRSEASAQMHIAMALRGRLPRVAMLFARGLVSATTVAAMTWRTRLVTSGDIAAVDVALAGAVAEWGPLTTKQLQQKVDGWVAQFDPVAVVRNRQAARGRGVHFGKPDDETGVTSVFGALNRVDAELFRAALDQLAAQPCAQDPRTADQRRADAVGVLAVRGTRLACGCGNADCPAAGVDEAAAAVVIHVLTDAVPPAQKDRELHTAEPPKLPAPNPNAPKPPERQPVGYLLGGEVIPPNMLADLAARGAKVTDVVDPADVHAVDSYRPPAAMARMVRMRYMTCTFPGCARPATGCDLDHVVPWPGGPTHPGNLNPKCRLHHLIKTFRGGPTGWRDRQEADGTIVWTAPTGHERRTVPGSRILFPDIPFDIPPPPTTPPKSTPSGAGRNMMMPTRRRTREQDRAARIDRERQLNQQEIDHENALAEQARQARKARRAKESREKSDVSTRLPAGNGESPPF